MSPPPVAPVARGAAEDRLIRAHLPLVQYAVSEIASRIPRYVSREDLSSAAMLGLAQAARTFDEARGVSFHRYARIRIKGALLDELRDRDWASRSVRARSRALQATSDELTLRLARTPTTQELSTHMGVPADELRRLADDVHRATVLNYETIFADADAEAALPSTGLSPEEELALRERTSYLHDAVVALPERLRAVIVGYFFDERQMQDIAVELGVTESRISQMRSEALTLIREGMQSQLEPDALASPVNATGRVARRKAAYYAAVAAGSTFRSRIEARPAPMAERLAQANGVGAGVGVGA